MVSDILGDGSAASIAGTFSGLEMIDLDLLVTSPAGYP
jgi:hypothetical protein